eukprot:10385244-Ditylum_brightwellii.AAC.1
MKRSFWKKDEKYNESLEVETNDSWDEFSPMIIENEEAMKNIDSGDLSGDKESTKDNLLPPQRTGMRNLMTKMKKEMNEMTIKRTS